MDNPEKFTAIVAVYGIVGESGDVCSEQAALDLFDKLREQAENYTQLPGMYGYRIVDVSIEGDRQQGKVIATFQHPGIPVAK